MAGTSPCRSSLIALRLRIIIRFVRSRRGRSCSPSRRTWSSTARRFSDRARSWPCGEGVLPEELALDVQRQVAGPALHAEGVIVVQYRHVHEHGVGRRGEAPFDDEPLAQRQEGGDQLRVQEPLGAQPVQPAAQLRYVGFGLSLIDSCIFGRSSKTTFQACSASFRRR